MTLATDIADDMSFMDGYQAMTLTPHGGSSVSCYGISHPLNQSQLSILGGIGLGPSDLSVSLSVSTLGGTEPKQGDRLTVGAVIYTIERADLVTRGTRYRCIARREA